MRARVVSSIGLSLALHAGGLVALSVVGVRNVAGGSPQVAAAQGFEVASLPRAVLVPLEALPPPEPVSIEPEPPPPPPPPMPEEPESPLGIEDGHENVLAWKGAREATENLAPKSKVDQAARAIDPRAGLKDAGPEVTQGDAGAAIAPGATGENSAPGEPQPAAAPAEHPSEDTKTQESPKQEQAPQPEPQPEPEQLEPPQPAPTQPEPEQPEPKQPQAVEPGVEEEHAGEVELPRPQLKPQQLEAPQPEPQQTNPPQPLDTRLNEQPQSPPVPEAPAGDNGGGAVGVSKASSPEAERGLKADEESPAASIAGSLVFKPGEPLAGKGLRVWTVTPKYAITTRYLARPKNAVVLITFGRNGKVIRAVFKERTGYDDVDKPLLEAVYRWTARGEALTKLPADNPAAGVTYSIKFLMESH